MLVAYDIGISGHEIGDQDLRKILDASRLAGIPGVIVQGRYDLVCPMRSAWELHRAWEGSELIVIPDAGHSAAEPGIRHSLIETTDRFARELT